MLIDTSKPLELIFGGKPDGDVPFITKTSEGYILVGKRTSKASAFDWAIFTTDGQFVRSSGGATGMGLSLRNKDERTVHYQRVDGCVFSSVFRTEEAARGYERWDQAVKVTKENGKVVSVELLP